MAYDFLVNRRERIIEMLNPIGYIHRYGIDGLFVDCKRLPNPPPNYLNFELLDDENYVTWSSSNTDKEASLNIIRSADKKIATSYYFSYIFS